MQNTKLGFEKYAYTMGIQLVVYLVIFQFIRVNYFVSDMS